MHGNLASHPHERRGPRGAGRSGTAQCNSNDFQPARSFVATQGTIGDLKDNNKGYDTNIATSARKREGLPLWFGSTSGLRAVRAAGLL